MKEIEARKVEIKNSESPIPSIQWTVVRTVLNVVVIVSDTIPVLAIPGSILANLNVASVLANRVGIRIPNLTPNINNGILGAGIVGEIFDTATLEMLPFPSSIFIHGAQILHDLPHIHNYARNNPKLQRIVPFTGLLNSVSEYLLRSKA